MGWWWATSPCHYSDGVGPTLLRLPMHLLAPKEKGRLLGHQGREGEEEAASMLGHQGKEEAGCILMRRTCDDRRSHERRH